MILIYEPADGEAERHDLDRMNAVESEAVERATGKTWAEVEQGLLHQSPTSLRACLWVFHKRQEPTLRFADFDVPAWRRRLKARLTADEIAEYVEATGTEYEPGTADYDQALRELRQLAEDPDDVRRAAEGGAAPKAKARSAAASKRSGSATAG